ncbi:carbonyl reductase-like [Tropilaelaps mercedesae]|uniref:carbonyl reductase (NADPH) n=1 Tax=Tropilaelaps mercedesae TaxID=418985 RepID=A0A1V9XJY5_9ACAR|nr:carbonyl reductase-like [Tropilaelaps mercedesae]
MVRRVAVITGANKGIGKSIVKHMLERGFQGDVILTARNQTRGLKAVEELTKLCSKAPLFYRLDVTDCASVEKLRDYIKSTYGGLDVLVNNAGITYDAELPIPYAEQAESVINTNYFGILNTSRIFFPLLRPSARVVHVSSMLGHLSKIPNNDLRTRFAAKDLTEDQLTALMQEFLSAARACTNEKLGWGSSSYNVSKVGVCALGFIQQRQFDTNPDKDLIVNTVHPGYVDTDMTKHKGPLTPDQGADAPTYLAMLPPRDPSNPKGQFVWYTRKIVGWDSDKMPRD